ncbi:DUF6653 family protein [Leucothrix arctica]|uniref:Uncharacterized protein n=1 Tax=Leucothrix arctica TaxID=1481894 RepID=A0A317C467_9GAMM|nr:DUF6653 family protein [Leucothrix arctica]PWQ93445.1 hypothetical protein DKT75_17605 [Leucothrix arctica]
MDMKKGLSKIFLPDEESWLHHANPWSIWTRFATLPFIVLAVWSRVWLGWYCLIPIVILVVWVVVNPRLFAKPTSFDNWGAKAVLGERVYITDKDAASLEKHKLPILILNGLQTIGGLILIYGLWDLNIYLTLHGMSFVYLAKMWFLDRMVWLYEDSQ